MDIRLATAEAKRLWGAGGVAWRRVRNGKALYSVGYDEAHEGSTSGYHAYGSSETGFNEAFANATRQNNSRRSP